MKRRTRPTLRSFAAGLLGLLTSIGVAWGIALSQGEMITSPAAIICVVKSDALMSLNESRSFGRRFRSIWYLDTIENNTPAVEQEAQRERWRTARASGDQHSWPDSWLRWGDLGRAHDALAMRRQSAFGFPLPCLWYERSGGLSPFGTAMRLNGGYEISKALGRQRSGFVAEAALPLRPIWLGLTLNTLLLSLFWWTGLSCVARWRRRRARRRGVCYECRYDLKGLPPGAPCPECGAGQHP